VQPDPILSESECNLDLIYDDMGFFAPVEMNTFGRHYLKISIHI
jgi:hypothetical protein